MKKLIASILVLSCSIASAQPADTSYEYNAQAFQKARALCQHADSDDLEESGSSQSDIDLWGLMQFIVKGTKTGVKFWRPDSFRVTPETAQFVTSDGFKSAMYACFGDNTTKQKAFKASILFLDFLGHFVGVAAWLFPTALVVRVFKSTSWAMSNPVVMSKMGRVFSVLNRGGLAVMVAMVGFQAWDTYQTRSNSKERLSELTDSLVDSAQEEADASFEILQNNLDETNKQLAHMAPGDAREKILLRRKAILEQALKNHPVTAAAF